MNKIFIVLALLIASFFVVVTTTTLGVTMGEKSSDNLNKYLTSPEQNSEIKGALAIGICCRR